MVQAAIDLDDELDRLYAGLPDAFVAGRNDLVRRLKAEGRRGDAERVGRLRRPTVVAWALNQVARARPDDVAQLPELGRRLTEAQEALLGGAGAQAVRDVSAERRRLLRSLADDAADRLGSAAGSHRDEVLATLEAASLDPEVGEALRAGRLEREEEPPTGFGTLLTADVVPVPAPARRPEPVEQPRAARDDGREQARADARRAVEAATRVAEEARKEADEAVREAEDADREVERLGDALRAAERAAAAARTSQGRAEREAERADRALEHAQRELDRHG